MLLATAYFVVTTLVDLPPLNNVAGATPGERRREILLNTPLLLLPVVLLAVAGDLKLAWLGATGSALELVVALGGLLLWWLPYLAGISVPWATGGTGLRWAGGTNGLMRRRSWCYPGSGKGQGRISST